MTQDTISLPPPLPTEQLPPEFRDAVATYRVDLSDGRSFALALDHGRLSLQEGGAPAPCVVVCSPDEFHRLLAGEIHLLAAVMRGDVRIHGDLESARTLFRYLRLVGADGARP